MNLSSKHNATALRAVATYHHPVGINFKDAAYRAWVSLGGNTAPAHYPWRWLHHWAFRHELPRIGTRRGEARLRFMEPVSALFDTFPDYARHEVVPMVWDCWPHYQEPTARWMERHDVRTAVFTARDTAEWMRQRLHGVDILWCPEAVDAPLFDGGKALRERTTDVLEFGRGSEGVVPLRLPGDVSHVRTKVDGHFIFNDEELRAAMADAKVSIALPHSITNPEFSGGLETLTQRYWECMLARMVMVGHAPRELVDLIGYNPVVEVPVDENAGEAYTAKILEILAHPDDYQPLVDRNRDTALRMGDWNVRMRHVMDWLERLGYRVK